MIYKLDHIRILVNQKTIRIEDPSSVICRPSSEFSRGAQTLRRTPLFRNRVPDFLRNDRQYPSFVFAVICHLSSVIRSSEICPPKLALDTKVNCVYIDRTLI